MTHVASMIAVGLTMAIFAVFGIAALAYSARGLVVAICTGTIRQRERTLSFQAAKVRFICGVVHISLGLLAGLLCLAFVVLFIAQSV